MSLRIAANLREGYVLDGKYRVERIIGVGGMGVVAAARHMELGIQVAVKVLLVGQMDTDEAIERFAREARAVSRLSSEHAVRVYDVGRAADGTPYMVMEHLVGRDLDTLLLEDGKLEISVVVGFILQACEAIAEAHSLGIVHRDLKPRNLFLTRRVDGSPLVKVLDFGIAKRIEPDAAGGALTKTMAVVGSPSYMSPEQMRAPRTVDARTDIWSLGVCLYELMTATLPFAGETAIAICSAAMNDDPRPPDRLRADISPELSRIVMRCLRRDPEERFRDVGSLAEALEPFATPSELGTSSRVREALETRRAAATDPPQEATSAPEPSPDARTALLSRASRKKRVLAGAWIAVVTLGVALAAGLGLARRTHGQGAATQTIAEIPAAAEMPAAASATTTALSPLPPPVSVEVPKAPPPDGRMARRPASVRPAPADLPAPVPPLPATPTPVRVDPPPPPAIPPADPTPPPSPQPPPPAPFVLASARVEIGSAVGVVGTTASNVNRAVAGLGVRATACYRDALPRMTAPFDGSTSLHMETDEEGVIVDARFSGPLAGALAACVGGAARGRKVPNVDTGRVRADVPLTFIAR